MIATPLPLGIDEFIEGEIYFSKDSSKYIFKYVNEDKTYDCYIYLNGGNTSFCGDSGSSGWKKSKTRLASAKEKAWFNACVDAGKLVPLSSINVEEEERFVRVSYETVTGETKNEVIKGPVENVYKIEGFKKLNYFIA